MGSVTSDSGNVLADLKTHVKGLEELKIVATLLDRVSGLVEHGIFLDQCAHAVICTETGDIKSYSRE